MLKKWIEDIRKQPELYKSESWKYHISGNVVELSILPSYLKDKKSYRCSVISIGGALKALSCRIEEQDLNFHIQTFPSIENPRLVATVRMDKNITSFRGSEKDRFHSIKECPAKVAICKLAEYHQLEIQELTDLFDFESEEINFDDFNSWYTLSSSFNNPFIWLNIGYLKETIQHDCYNLLAINDSIVIDCCTILEDEKPHLETPENKYLQSIIGFNPATA